MRLYLLHLALATFCPSDPPKVPIPIWSGSVIAADGTPKIRLYLSSDRFDGIAVPSDDAGTTMAPVKVPLGIRFEPEVKVSAEPEGDGSILYTYVVLNGSNARDAIVTIDVVVSGRVSPSASTVALDEGWKGSGIPVDNAPQLELERQPSGSWAGWYVRGSEPYAGAIRPGQSLDDFHIKTDVLPGFSTIYFSGIGARAPVDGANEEGTEYKGVDLGPLFSNIAIREYSLLTLAPIIPRNASFADVKSNYLAGLRRLEECGRTAGDDEFYERLKALLDKASSASDLQRRLDQFDYKARTDLENEILSCLKITAKGLAAPH